MRSTSGRTITNMTIVGALIALLTLVVAPIGASAQDDDGGNDRVHLINGIPDQEVDVTIEGEPAIQGFAFRDVEDISSLAGSDLASVVFTEAGTDEVLLDATNVEIPAASSVSVLLHLKVDGSPSLSIFENDLSRIAAGESRLVIRHLAAAPPVDVLAAGDVVFQGIGNGDQQSADVPAGDVTASVVPSGEDGPVVIGPADLPLLEGVMLIVYGLGSLERGTMTVITETVEGLSTPPSAVDTGNSPVPGERSDGYLLVGAVAVAALGVGAATALTQRAGRRPEPSSVRSRRS